jgi:Amt family ammonium transporter
MVPQISPFVTIRTTADSSAGTIETGGNSLTQDLNVFYNVYTLSETLHDSRTHFWQAGDIAWMITATALVLLMIPGVG